MVTHSNIYKILIYSSLLNSFSCAALCDYTCADGQCLYEKLIHVCDGHEDCRDGSDEYGCEGDVLTISDVPFTKLM